MTTDPWELLRDARQYVGFCPITQEGMETIGAVRTRIDAAFAERQDSATGVVEWRQHGLVEEEQIFDIRDGYGVVRNRGDDWSWMVARRGRVATEAEAKAAAIEAAKGLK